MWAFLAVGAALLRFWVRWRRSGRPLSYFSVHGATKIYSRLWHGCHIDAHPPLDEDQGILLVSNHTSSPDPLFIMVAFHRLISFLYAKEFGEKHSFLKWIFRVTFGVSVDRNKCEIRAAREGLRRLQEGHIVCVFPEANLRRAGKTKLGQGRCGAAWLALRSRAPVYPIFISGGPQTPNLRRAWLSFSKRRARVTLGKPIDLTPYYDRPITRPLLEEVTRLLMDHIARTDPRASRRSS